MGEIDAYKEKMIRFAQVAIDKSTTRSQATSDVNGGHGTSKEELRHWVAIGGCLNTVVGGHTFLRGAREPKLTYIHFSQYLVIKYYTTYATVTLSLAVAYSASIEP